MGYKITIEWFTTVKPNYPKLGFSQIFYSNLKEFGQVVVSEHLWDILDQIKVGMIHIIHNKSDM
jgi:hypothetical protein